MLLYFLLLFNQKMITLNKSSCLEFIKIKSMAMVRRPPAHCLFPNICFILIVTFSSCFSGLGSTLMKGDLELDYRNGTPWTINICETKELYVDSNVTTGSVLLHTGENNNTGECSVTVNMVKARNQGSSAIRNFICNPCLIILQTTCT